VHVQVIDRLAAAFSGVDHHPISIAKPFLTSDFTGRPDEVAKKRALTVISLVERIYVLTRDDKDMDGRLGINIGKGVGKVVLVNRGRGNLTFKDFAEEATHGDASLHGQWRFIVA
jgi:hypothetical protein